jgi:hypothetical protein
MYELILKFDINKEKEKVGEMVGKIRKYKLNCSK